MKMNFSFKYIIFSVLLSVATSVFVYCFFPSYSIIGFDKALDGVLLFSSINLGFYGSCLSVLASIFNTKVVKEIMGDQRYRREFVIISGVNLAAGFLTVIITIVYQVMLGNDEMSEWSLSIINSFWFGICVLYLSLTILFIVVMFMIFLNNTDDKKLDVYDGNVGNPNFFR